MGGRKKRCGSKLRRRQLPQSCLDAVTALSCPPPSLDRHRDVTGSEGIRSYQKVERGACVCHSNEVA